MFRGAPGLTANQLAGIYARMGGDMDAYTTNAITSYFFTVPADDIDVALRVGAIRMAGVDDSEAEWAKERGAIEQEVARDNSSPLYGLYEKLLAHMFAGTPYAHDALGTKTSFDRTTGAMLRNFHARWYAPNNALLVVVGDVDPQTVLRKIRKLYGPIPARRLPVKPAIVLKPVSAETFRTPSDEPYGVVLVAFRLPGYRSPDYPAAALASRVLASQRGPIAALRYRGVALAAGFETDTRPEAGIGFAYAVYPPGGGARAVRRALVAAIDEVRKDGVAPDLVAAAMRRVVLSGELQRNSIAGLATAWTDAIALAQLDSPAEAVARLRRVTAAEVDGEIRTRLDLAHAVTLVARPTPGARARSGSGYGGNESFATHPSQATTLPAWARRALARLPHPRPFLHPLDLTLANGLRLIVQPLHVSRSVSLYGVVRQNEDTEAPAGEEGVADLLGNLFDWGPQGMTRIQFDAAQDAIGADLSVGPRISLQVLPQYFAQGVKLLAADQLRPALPAAAFRSQQAILARSAQGQEQSPMFRFQRAVDEALLPKGDPALRLATGKSVMSLTLAKLRAYYGKVYRPDETTLVVIGDITPARAKSVVEKYFGAWRASGPRPKTDYPSVPLSKPSHVFVPDPMREQDRVVMAETLGLGFTRPAHFALDLANDLLSGGFYASPLYKVLREERGLVYTLNSQFSFERHRARYNLAFGADPDKVAEAQRLAVQELARLRAEPLTANQLNLAKAIGLRQIELADQSVDAIGWGWVGRSEDRLPLDWNYVMAQHFRALTAKEVQAAMKSYLDPDRLATVVLGRRP